MANDSNIPPCFSFFLRTFLMLWVVCVVLVQCEEESSTRGIHKRDLHRIILPMPRRTRSHKPHHHHRHHHHSRGHKHKGHKHHHPDSYEIDHSHSYEESSASVSSENSYEDPPKKSRTKHSKRHKTHSNYSPNVEYERPTTLPTHEEWTPLFNSFDSYVQASQESHKAPKSRKHKESKRHKHRSKPIEITTSYPAKQDSYSFYESDNYPVYPPLEEPYNTNKKIIDSLNSPLVAASSLSYGTEQDSNGNYNYQNQEHLKGDIVVNEHKPYRGFSPSLNVQTQSPRESININFDDDPNENRNDSKKADSKRANRGRHRYIRVKHK